MRQRLLSHLTYANVMVTILAFLVLGGGTALAAYVVSSNSQIGPGTVSGHKPPTGKHANIIAGSVNGQDVAGNSLGGRVIAEPALTGNARKLLYSGEGFFPKKIATVGPYAIRVRCASSPHVAYVDLAVKGPAGTADYLFTERSDDSEPEPESGGTRSATVRIPANQGTSIYNLRAATEFSGPGSFTRGAGMVMLRSGSVLVQLDLNLGVDGNGQAPWPGMCIVYGTGTRAT